jgi:hypothetical protein
MLDMVDDAEIFLETKATMGAGMDGFDLAVADPRVREGNKVDHHHLYQMTSCKFGFAGQLVRHPGESRTMRLTSGNE